MLLLTEASYYHVAGTTAWHEEQVATGVGATPSIGWTGSTVIITDTDAHGNLDYWYSTQAPDPGTSSRSRPRRPAAAGPTR